MELQDQLKIWETNYQQYAEDNLWIIDKAGKLVPFIFNRMQRKIWKLVFYFLSNGLPIRLLIIKDRQLGFTTFIAGMFYWIATLFPNKNTLIVSHDIESAAGIFGKVKLFFKKSKEELRPLRKISNRRELYFANPDESGQLGLESRIAIDTADSENIGVSYTLQFVLLSEMAVWEAMGLDIKKRLVALNQSVPKLPATGIIIETTPRGEGYVSNMYFDDKNGYTKVFISSCASDEYRIEIPKDKYFELINYQEHTYGNEVEEYSYYEKELQFWYDEINFSTIEGRMWLNHEVMCRLAWRRKIIDENCEGDKLVFDREYPITIEKAFAAIGSNLFNNNKLNEIQQQLKINSPTIITYKYSREMDNFYSDIGGNLKIFRDYDSRFKYVMGCDVGQGGIGGDDSSISCRRLPGLAQVFTYSEVIKPLPFARIINSLGRIYGVAFVGVETNEKGGYSCQEYLENTFKYPYMYSREVIDKPYGDINTEVKYGWRTDRFTKPTMVSDYDEAIMDGLELLDDVLIEQAKKYKLKIIKLKQATAETTTLMGASVGKDDLLIADMIALQLAKYIPVQHMLIPQQKKWTANWWLSLLDNQSDDIIGNFPKGPDNYSDYIS